MAERVGFEPMIPLTVCKLSKPVPTELFHMESYIVGLGLRPRPPSLKQRRLI